MGERLPLWVRTRCGLERRGLVVLVVVLVLGVGLAAHHFWEARPQPVRVPQSVGPAPPERGGGDPRPGTGAEGTAGAGTAPDPRPGAAGADGRRVVVDVGGEVRRPGVLRLPFGARVTDALRAAGVRPGTDLTGLNQARVLVDGEQVVVGAPRPEPGGEPDGNAPVPSGPVAPGQAPGPVSLGSATVEQLDALPGVGPVLAQRILDHRAAQGGFRTVEQLRDVTGIGERRFADLKDLVRP
ncbi:helix-hairpin-helix domain-containing protein [Streptomyces sp. JNUCC 64]